jgi:hypothetical protein
MAFTDPPRKRYLLAELPADLGPWPRQASRSFTAIRSTDIPINQPRPWQPVRDFASLHDAAGRAPTDPRRQRRVIALSDDELVYLRRHYGGSLRVEPDHPLVLFPMPGLPPMVDVQAPTRELRLWVGGEGGQPVEDCSVYVVSGGVGYKGETDESGALRLQIGAEPIDRLIFSPRTSWWSQVITEPEMQAPLLTAAEPFCVNLKSLHPDRDLNWVHQLLGVPEAWGQFRTYGANVRVAIVDSGVDPTQGALYPAGGFNTLDSGDPSVWWIDEKGHGTHCAGLIGGQLMPFSGISPQAEIYAVKVFPGGFISDLVEAIDWCIDQRMDVVNLSLGSPRPSQALQDVLLRAYAAGITVIAAAGNDATHVAYPAASKPSVFSVGALGRFGSFPADSAHSLKIGRYRDGSATLFTAGFSNFGVELDVVAPGVAITSTVPTGFAAWDGTSMASPLVAGVAALVLSASPWLRSGDWRQVQALTQSLRLSARPLGLPSSLQGAGIPHAGHACAIALSLAESNR